ncbi:uncharacterized protein LOC111001302 [Pieris rapae]|uniref:uncharacterized protein LOC111001302 n=1 Tax=Pieris rapae TaxID=64459 RepID=UPI001E2804FE|nr:uncharacterized protein LOC111001302 [Pieris rapae]
MRWSEKTTQDFIRMYLKNECLWNTNHADYKLKHRRDKAYASLSEEFNAYTKIHLSTTEIKIKIKNLRSTYMQEVNKVLQKSSPEFIYKPSLVWFDEMDRCLKHTYVRRSSSNSSIQQAQEVDSSSQIWVNQVQENLKEEIDPDPLIPDTDNYCDSPKPDDSNREESETSNPPKKTKKKKYKHTKSIPEPQTDCTKEDEFDIFGKYIATQLRTMNLHKALRLQLEIHSLVNEARVADIND